MDTTKHAVHEGHASKAAKSVDRNRGGPASSRTDQARQHAARPDVHGQGNKSVATATGKDRERPSAEPRSSATITISGGGQSARHAPREKPHKAKISIHHFFNAVVYWGRRGPVATDDNSAPLAGSRTPPRSAPSSISEETLHSQSMHNGEKAPAPSEDDPRPSADTKLTENNSAEQQEIQRLRRDLSISRSRIAELQQRRETQSKDKVASSGFLDIADTSSDADVIRALQKLNAELQQNATYMTDCLLQDLEFKTTATDATKEYISLVEKVSGHVGPVLTKSLGPRPQELPLSLQIAFQAYLATALGQIASAWTSDPGHNSFIDSIYQALRGAEAQATAGRWRSLARLYDQRNGVNHPEALVERLVADLSDILLVSGCSAPSASITAEIASKFREKIALLVDLAMRLNKTLNEVVSSDFEVLVVRPGHQFEGDTMEETDGSGAGVRDGSVALCATHLGLMKHVPVGTLWEKGKRQKMVVLKAKVLLESLFDAED